MLCHDMEVNNRNPTVSVVVPLYNTQRYIAECIDSVLAQSFADFELIVVNDGSTDGSTKIVQSYADKRMRLVNQENRGLAGARNTGTREARGTYIAFLDADDYWHPDKLALHVSHLDDSPNVGVSYSGSIFIDENSLPLGIVQRPKLSNISTAHILCRNPVGNGSSPVVRKDVFNQIEFTCGELSHRDPCYFDEDLQQSEDIECWLRMSLTTDWLFEGIKAELTYYRVSNQGLSTNLAKQFKTWEAAIGNNRHLNPSLFRKYESLAKAYQFRYLARRAVQLRDPQQALHLFKKALDASLLIVVYEAPRTFLTFLSICALNFIPRSRYQTLENIAMRIVR
ncbi:MAG: glycosyltransferase [Pseudomonadales bacterium]